MRSIQFIYQSSKPSYCKFICEATPQSQFSLKGKVIIIPVLVKRLVCMSQQLTLELSDEVYAALQQKANAVGLSITEWSVAALSQQSTSVNEVPSSKEQQEAARLRFRNHAGAIRLGCATGADNESIDADLARAYADEY